MSFVQLKKDQLVAAAEAFGVDIEPTDIKEVIIKKLDEDGVTFDSYQKFFTEEDKELEVVPNAVTFNKNVQRVLIKMTRANHSYQVRGYEFTSRHPFQAVDRDNADYILEYETGFRMATPKEVEAFYG